MYDDKGLNLAQKDRDDGETNTDHTPKSARGHMMPPPLHLSDIRFKCFPYRRCHGKQTRTMNVQTMKVPMSAVERYCIIVLLMKNIPVKFLIYYVIYEICQ